MAVLDAGHIVPAAGRATPGRWRALAVLTAIFAVHYVDRGVMAVVVEPIKREFALSDTAMGVLAGFAHSTALSIMVVPAGLLADRTARVRLLAAVVFLWSALTGIGALAQGYLSLLLVRIGVGAAEAAGPPTSVSLIADIFPRKELPTAMGIFYTAAALGTGIVFLAGGFLAQHYGWRTVFLVAGLPGIVMGIVLLATVPEPVRAKEKGRAAGATAGLFEALRNRTLCWIIVAGTSASIAQAATWVWLGSFMIRERGLTLSQAGAVVGGCAGLGMGLGSLLSGPLARIVAGDKPHALWRWPGAMLILSVPIGWAMVSLHGVGATLAAAIVLSVVIGSWSGQAVGILASGVPAVSRGTSTSLYQLSTNLFGVGIGPILTGAISDAAGTLGHAIAWTLGFNLVAAAGFYLAARTLDEPRVTLGPRADGGTQHAL